MRVALNACLVLLLVGCNDSTTEIQPDGGKKDTRARDGVLVKDGVGTVDGVLPPDGVPLDGAKPPDGVKPPDGAKPPDGPKPPDAPATDGPKPPDGPKPDGKDLSVYVDGVKTDGPKGDGFTPTVDQFILPDKYLGDGPPAGWDGIIGKTDAGKYLCKSASGATVICECNDGIDNDADKKIDFPTDTGCIGPWDNQELGGSTQCSDGIDNDGDGKVDAADPECTGPLDNDESSYATGIPGDNMDPCNQDCFFDGNSGSGDDKCSWNFKCDPNNPGQYMPKPCPYDPNYKNCPTTQLQNCILKCAKITPNGCDCFGCCTLTYGGVTKAVMLTPSCKPEFISDPTKCPPCTQNADCVNPCGLCEVCVGKPAPDPSCFPKLDGGPKTDAVVPKPDGGTNPFCPGTYLYCGPGGIDPNSCPAGTYCITGCCISPD